MDVVFKYLATMPLLSNAARTVLVAVAVADSASFELGESTETVALIRTPSGVTFTVPVEERLMYRLGEVLALADDPVTSVDPRITKANIASADLRTFLIIHYYADDLKL